MNKLSPKDIEHLDAAYQEAIIGKKEGGIPIGAVLVIDNQIVARGHNKRVQEASMIKHGEMDCLENTKCRITPEQLQMATLYTSLSPCFMCAGAILNNSIPRVVIGENQTFQQSEALLNQQGVQVVVANDPKLIKLMKDFIKNNPELWGRDIGLTPAQILKRYHFN